MRIRRRQAFTLVELMVAMALIIFIMAILSEAFVVGMKTFRDLKAVGDMDQNLRTITVNIRGDLSSDHFEGRRRLSDPTFWAQGIPREGFFRALQMTPVQATVPVGGIAAPGYYDEGPDGDGNHSFVATDHRLHFTVKRRGNQKDRFFSASIPAASPLLIYTNFDSELGTGDGRMQDPSGTTYNSQWAEVGYFLLPTTDGAGGPGPIGTPLFALYRVELAITPDNSKINWPSTPLIPGAPVNGANLPAYAGLSCNVDSTSGNLYFNNPSDLTTTTPINRRTFDPVNILRQGQPAFTAQNANLLPATLLMTDVISFHVQMIFAWDKAISQGPGVQEVLTQENQVFGTFRDFNSFDTGTPLPVQAPPPPPDPLRPADTNPPRVVGIKISIRVWDAKTQQARQITVVQDM